MATKTYFGYQSQLKSKELTEAIALQHGPGPLFGYAGFSISGNVISITPTPDSGDSELSEFISHFGKLVNNRLTSKRVIVQSLESVGNFGIVTKDGYIEINDTNYINVNISNNRSTYPEVILLARHNYSEDVNVEMPVVYEAYWNQSSTSFFSLYKKSIDFNYPTPLNSRAIEGLDINMWPQEDNQLSYSYLHNKALAATGLNLDNLYEYTLVGIYGSGNDELSSSSIGLQKFIIIPYDSKFPMELTYSWNDINFNKDLLRYLYKVFEGIGNLTFRQYLRKILNESDEDNNTVPVSLPVGTIVMWYGSNIPYGWEICNGEPSIHNPDIVKPNLLGRFPIGLNPNEPEYSSVGTRGGNNTLVLDISNIPQHKHIFTGDDNCQGKFGSVETGFPKPYEGATEAITGTAGSSGNQGIARAYFTSNVGGSKPVDNRPAYTVVTFIIKTLN